MLGLSLFLYGLALALGTVYRRWAGWMAAISGAAFMVQGVMASYEGFFSSIPGIVGVVLLAVWALIIAVLMWRNGSRQLRTRPEESAPQESAQ